MNPIMTKACCKCGDLFNPTYKIGRDYSYCKKCTSLKRRQDWAKNKEKIAEQNRASHVKNTYGLDRDAYNELLKSQNNVCDICKEEKPLAVDHDHVTGKTRGLLCKACNTALGMFKDNPERLGVAISYLDKHKKDS